MINALTKIFDIIDDNIKEKSENIQRALEKSIGYDRNYISKCITVLFGYGLKEYITRRKLFYIGVAIENESNEFINLAYEYEFADQPALNRAFKKYFNCKPTDIRQNKFHIPDERASFKFENDCKGNCYMNSDFIPTTEYINYLEEIYQISDEYRFSVDDVFAIAELADELNIPTYMLAGKCFETQIECFSDPNYISPKKELAINLELGSIEEINDICEYFNCKWYWVTREMVEDYQHQK